MCPFGHGQVRWINSRQCIHPSSLPIPFSKHSLRQARLHEQLQQQTEELAKTNSRLQQEIAERQRAEQSLRENSNFVRAIFEGTSDGIFVKDSSGRYRLINAAGAAWIGKSVEDIIGQDDTAIFEPDVAARIMAHDRQVIQTGASVEYEETTTNNGTYRTFLSRKDAYRDGQGQINGVIGVARDITEHKRTEAALQDSRERFTTFMAHSPAIAFIKDAEGRLHYINPAFIEAFGSAAKAWEGKIDAELWPADTAKQLRENDLAILSTGKSQAAEEIIPHPDGLHTWLTYKFPFRDAAGRLFLGGMGIDITERNRAEAALRAAEEEYHAIFEHANIGIYRSSLEGKQLRANPALVRLNGYTSEEEMLPAVKDIAVEWYVDPQRRSEFARLLETHEHVENFESEIYRHKARERIWISETARLVRNQAGEPLYYEGTVQDITARKRAEEALRQSEQRYRGLVESQQDLVVRVDSEGKFTFLNDAYCQTFGKPREELLGQSFLQYVHPDDRESTQEAMQALSVPPYRVSVEQRILTPKGIRWMAWEDYAIRDQRGAILEIQAVGRDVTDRKQTEQNLQESNHRLEEILHQLQLTQQQIVRQERLAAVGQLAAGIAHDFNNILTGILGFAELLQLESSLSPFAHEGLRTVAEQGKRAAQLIRQVLDFSRQSINQPQPLDLTVLLKETGKLLSRLLPEHVQVHINPAPGEHWMQGDVTQLQQVLTNLAVNARDAMPNGGVLEFRLFTQALEAEHAAAVPQEVPAGHWIVLEACDTGTGMTPEVQERIFEPFFSTKEVGKGTGLGLSQVYGIAKQHQGHIHVQSQLGQGSTFSLYFPTLSVAAESDAQQEMLLYGQGETILLVEDEVQVRKVLQAMLQRLGYCVLATANGQEALSVYETHSHKVQLVITDMVTPEMGGDDLYARLVRLNPHLKIIVISGYPLGEERRALVTSGRVRCLPKPPPLQALALAVHEVLHESSEKKLEPTNSL
ncbi:MAG: PAS domain S-box protein [Deltaproteobacteria bacterium]|nr:PAS domain S-box protein [Deltaproteobacteria bacterium]